MFSAAAPTMSSKSPHLNTNANHAWVTRPERPKGAKDEVKEARRDSI